MCVKESVYCGGLTAIVQFVLKGWTVALLRRLRFHYLLLILEIVAAKLSLGWKLEILDRRSDQALIALETS